MAHCVEIRGAGKTYRSARGPVTALTGVGLDIREGEFLSLLGPSGCGKSTLLRCIAGLDQVPEGSIRIRGAEVRRPPEGLGMVFQRDVLVDWRSILDNVLLAAEFQGLPRKRHMARATALLERFGLGAFADRHPWELSGGMRQRAAICRALLCEPEILLMDEPFGALDAGRTVIFVTHSIAEAVYLSDRVAVMSPGPGRVVEIFDIGLPRPRPLSLRETPEFAHHVGAIRGLFSRLGIVKE